MNAMDRKHISNVKLACVVILMCLLRKARFEKYQKWNTNSVYQRTGIFNGTLLARSSRLRCVSSCAQQNCSIVSFSEDTTVCRTVTSGIHYIDGFSNSAKTTVYTTQEYSSFPWIFCPTNHSDLVVAMYANTTLTFKVITTVGNYSEAYGQCVSSGKRLMRIDTPEKQNAVANILISCSHVYSDLHFWIDGQQVSPAYWVYSDNSTMPLDNTVFWRPGWTPYATDSISPVNQCASMSKQRYYRWRNRKCLASFLGHICE